MNKVLGRIFGLMALVLSVNTHAALMTHTPADAQSAGVAVTSPFGPLAAGGIVGDTLIDFGVDYSFGNVEGYFDDPPLSFCGINGSNVCDLFTDVDARIVMPGTTSQGFTNFVQVEAGFFNSPDNGTLSVFDIDDNLLASVNGSGIGLNGKDLFTISRATADIAYFVMSGADSYGVPMISIEVPIRGNEQPAGVPVPGVAWLFVIGIAGLLGTRKGWDLPNKA